VGAFNIAENPDFEFFSLARGYRRALEDHSSTIVDWKTESPDLSFANNCALASVVSIFGRAETICLLNIDTGHERRSAICAAMFQNIALVEAAIVNAQYVGAATLVRQELEGIEALRGILKGQQKDGRTPRLIGFRHLGEIYGQLSGIAHLSKHAALSHLTGGIPFSYDTQYNLSFAELLVNCHVLALVGLANFVAYDSRVVEKDYLTIREENHLTLALSVLSKNGFLKLKPS
jgi:hypothetical protein